MSHREQTITIDGEEVEVWKLVAFWRVMGNPHEMLYENGLIEESEWRSAEEGSA